jgi:hypothetical protein
MRGSTRTSMRLALLACAVAPCSSYWEGDRATDDPYTHAMKMSRQAQYDPNVMQRDPDHFKRMFGQLAFEQAQAKSMDETQSTASAKDRCMACHGVVVEFEKMMKERVDRTRSQLTTTETLEKICHLNRYEIQDPVDIRKREERSRVYGGLAPPVFANACKKIVDAWQDDDDEIEGALLRGGSAKSLYKELREKICHRKGGICEGTGVEIATQGKDKLIVKGAPPEQCGAPGSEDDSKKKKKKKKQQSQDEIDAPPEFSIS